MEGRHMIIKIERVQNPDLWIRYNQYVIYENWKIYSTSPLYRRVGMTSQKLNLENYDIGWHIQKEQDEKCGTC